MSKLDIEALKLHGYEADEALQKKNPEALDWPYIADAQLAKVLWALVDLGVQDRHFRTYAISFLMDALEQAGIERP